MSNGSLSEKVSMRRFVLQRDEDESGVSGTGIVAEGVELSSGQVVLTFRSMVSAVSIYHSIKAVKEIHGHEGKTKIVWIDCEDNEDEDGPAE